MCPPLKAIKELIHSPIRAKYTYSIQANVFQHLLNIKQQENKGLLNYIAKFKQERDKLKEYTGNRILEKCIENMNKYKSGNTIVQQNLKNESFNYVNVRNVNIQK